MGVHPPRDNPHPGLFLREDGDISSMDGTCRPLPDTGLVIAYLIGSSC